MELLNRIQEAQNGNNDASLLLIKKFNPLLKKYAKKLGYDDAYNDLLVDFLSVIKKINLNRLYNPSDGAIVLYFSKSVYLSYIHKSKALYKYVHTISPLSTLNKEEQYHVEVLLSSLDSHEMLETISLQEILNRNEWFIIFNIFQNRSGPPTNRKIQMKRVGRCMTKVISNFNVNPPILFSFFFQHKKTNL